MLSVTKNELATYMRILHTDNKNNDFIHLCELLDTNLDEIVGSIIQRDKFHKFNYLYNVSDVIVIYIVPGRKP